MRNYFFYILIICSFTKTFGKDENQTKSSEKEFVKHTRAYYEHEAKKDIENLLSSLMNQKFSEEDENNPVPLMDDLKRSNKVMARIDHVLKSRKKLKKDLRTDAQINTDNYRRGVHLQNLPPSFKNAFGNPNMYNFNDNINQQMNKFGPIGVGNVKGRISGGRGANTMLRSGVNYIDIKPEVYPLITGNVKNNNPEIAPKMDIVNDKIKNYLKHDGDLTKLVNKIDLNKTNDAVKTTATTPMPENFGLGGLVGTLNIKGIEKSPTGKELDPNALQDLLKIYRNSPPVNYMRPANGVDNLHYNLGGLNANINSNDKDNRPIIHLRSDAFDKVNPSIKQRFYEIMKILDSGKNLKTTHDVLSHDQAQSPNLGLASQDDGRSRHRRSTQAGYTQDPDICKTYNDNLAKLWSNLTKIINIKDKPNDTALHNIAMIIQAYLEHQQTKPSVTHKVTHKRHKDKISETMLRIRKLLEDAEGSHEKITKIIIKYLKPDYTHETEDCQQVNEENLGISVDLLYKNYLEKNDCQQEVDDITRNKKASVRHRTAKGNQNMAPTPLPTVNRHNKPEFNEGESYSDFYNGRTQIKRPTNKNRRVFKPWLLYKSDSRNENKNVIRQRKTKSARKNHKKSSLKSNVHNSKCEKSATRKLIVSLRPVMERFLGLLECRLDNTLRSASSSSYSDEYSTEMYSLESSRPHRNNSRKLPRQQSNQSQKKMYTRSNNYQERRDRDNTEHETEAMLVKKHNFNKTTHTNSAKPAIVRDDNAGASDTDYQYFLSPPQYDEYDGIYKTNHNTFPSLINPSTSLNDKTLDSFDKDEDYEVDDSYYDDDISEEANYLSSKTQTAESTSIKIPLVDLTKLRTEDQLIKEKIIKHVQIFETLTDFLKKSRDESLQTAEFTVPLALDSKNGYVELTHLIKHPKTLVYRPQYLVKNTMPYDDFLKTINNSNMTNDNVRLMKIVRHLSDGSVQVLFETDDTESPLEIRNLNDKDNNGRSGLPVPINNQSESRIDRANENYNVDGNNEAFSLYDDNESRRNDVETPSKDISSTDEYNNTRLTSDSDLDSVGQTNTSRHNEELFQSNFNDNSDTNSTSISKLNSTESGLSGFSSTLSSYVNPQNPDFSKDVNSAIETRLVSQVGAGTNLGSNSQIGSGMQIVSDTTLDLGLKSNLKNTSQLDSFFSKLIPSHSKTKAAAGSFNSQSHINSHFDSSSNSFSPSNSYNHLNSHSWSNNQEVDRKSPSSTKLAIAQWWRKWKNIFKGKMKKIFGKVARLSDDVDRIIQP